MITETQREMEEKEGGQVWREGVMQRKRGGSNEVEEGERRCRGAGGGEQRRREGIKMGMKRSER